LPVRVLCGIPKIFFWFAAFHAERNKKLDIYIIVVALLGLFVGTLNAATGLGWGILTLPVLFMIPGLSTRQAVATLLIGYFGTGLVASFENARHGLINWKFALFLALGGAVGSFFGAYMLRNLPVLLIRRTAGVVVLLSGLHLLYTSR
jgi:hypothetical protein